MKNKIIFFLLMISINSYASELRCGWLQNPTPGNQWLSDKDGIWDISLHGDYMAQGVDKIKGFPGGQYVKTNGDYGYWCSCIKVDVDLSEKKITQIYSSKVLPLDRCLTDKTLPRP